MATSCPMRGLGRELALENPDAFFLSQSGECFHNVTVTGGKQRAEGPLSMKRELREVLRLLEELERALRDGEGAGPDAGPRDQGTHFPARPSGGRKARSREAGHDFRPHAAAAGCGDGAGGRASEREPCPNCSGWRRSARSRKRLSARARRRHCGRRRASARNWNVTWRWASERTASTASSGGTLAAQTTSQHVARVAGLEERHRSAAAVLERIECAGRRDAGAGVRAAHADRRFGWRRKSSAKTRISCSPTNWWSSKPKGTPAKRGKDCCSLSRSRFGRGLLEIDEALRTARQLLDQARDRRGELAATAAKLQSDAQYMAESCLNDLGVQRHELMADTTIPIVAGDNWPAKTRLIARCARASTPWARST